MKKKLILKWYESWVVKASIGSALVLVIGYGLSLFLAVRGIDSISRLIYDKKIEDALTEYGERINESHQLAQKIVVTRVQSFLERIHLKGMKTTAENLRGFLESEAISSILASETVRIREIDGIKLPLNLVKWESLSKLQVENYYVEFPESKNYLEYKELESLRQRYLLTGVALSENLKPAIIRNYSYIILSCFMVLGIAVFLFTRRYKSKLEEVIKGFAEWSEEGFNFRFGGKWPGELRLITDQFNAMASEVERGRIRALKLEKIASWQNIARKIAHEIKNPLTPIQMMVSQVNRSYRGEDEEFKSLLDKANQIISHEIESLKRMVESFSRFSKLPSPKFESTDMVALCSDVVELEKAAYGVHDIQLDAQQSKVLVNADADLIRQVVINLIKNAAEACGESPTQIVASVQQRDKECIIVVKDFGPGIPENIVGRIFEAYFTTKHSEPNSGMGLGLAVCQKIILDHKGEITVDSKAGETEFTIKLPINEGNQHG